MYLCKHNQWIILRNQQGMNIQYSVLSEIKEYKYMSEIIVIDYQEVIGFVIFESPGYSK